MPADASGSRATPSGTRELTLHIGVTEIPYAFDRPIKDIKGFSRTKAMKSRTAKSITTGEVAQILEDEYGLFSVFERVHRQDIADALAESVNGALESLLMGQSVDPWGAGTQVIDQMFRDWINSGESEKAGMAGVPTKAALAGVNHRLSHPYARRNPRRPSFRDTGLLSASLKSFVD
jgi:hypothetical protein